MIARRCCFAMAEAVLLLALHAGNAAAELRPPALSEVDLEHFLDPLMREHLQDKRIAGAVVVVVQDGKTVLAKGYGHADLDNQRPMTADMTLVRPGSISKLFTGIAVMQLVDQGRLDLDRDVNNYIDFAIPTPEGSVPVTLRNLLTHRAGFEEHFKGLIVRDPVPLPLGRWLIRALPPRLFPAGDVGAYSNYGLALAGYIVERVAGEPFADYIAGHVLQPLNMTHSTFHQPLPEALAPMMAQGYTRSDEPPLGYFETISTAPASALSATGADMGRFMRALLDGGKLDGARILSEEGLAQMMDPQIAVPTGSLGLVFYETRLAGKSFVGHDGGTMTFFSRLLLSPQDGFGLFVSYDGFVRKEGGVDPVRAIIQRYFPVTSQPLMPVALDLGNVQPFAGTYRTSIRAESTLVRLRTLMSQQLFQATSNGTLSLRAAAWPFGDAIDALIPVGQGYFKGKEDQEYAFEDLPGRDMRLFNGAPIRELNRVPWHQDARLVLPLVATSALVAALMLLSWPVTALIRRWRGLKSYDDWMDRHELLAVRLVLFLQLSAIFGAAVLYVAANMDPTILNDRLDPVIVAVYGTAWLGSFGSIVALWVVWRSWWQRLGSLWTRLHRTILAAASLTLAWFLITWRIAGTTLNY